MVNPPKNLFTRLRSEISRAIASFKRKPGTNDLTLEIITYGKNNGIDKVFPIGGINGKVVETGTEKFSIEK
ncbi:MAG: hypothetical protein Ct9H90mP22_5730 [Gammaproteobacteria bacterium]|nr:MAG: hypothetical protein Ct9H90mP22_5730 [Gammaproteobacteria bacterium]